MGRFDALTTLTNDAEQKAPVPDVPSPAPQTPVENAGTSPLPKSKKPDGKPPKRPATPSLPSASGEKPMKYSTLIDPGLIKKIKLYAAERELKDYEVIERALIAYFETAR